jgi:hypothetical protein
VDSARLFGFDLEFMKIFDSRKKNKRINLFKQSNEIMIEKQKNLVIF